MSEKNFKDYFSVQSSDYQKYRPTYPDNLYTYLASISSAHDCAWDCATGNGQAALGLSKHFTRVIATDASRQQLDQAMPASNIEYQCAPAENSLLDDSSVDLITVAQALHWFDLDKFYKEVGRVLKAQGVVAVWGYNLLTISSEIDQIIYHLYADILGEYWPPERLLIENGYRDMAFPFQRIAPPEFTMQTQWNLQQLTGYFQTWSALQRYIKINNSNPLQIILPMLSDAWGDPQTCKAVRWPLHVMLGQNFSSSN